MGKLLRIILPVALTIGILPAGAAPSARISAPVSELATVPVYLAVDVDSRQVLAQREADRPFLPASVTKVMTLWVAFELIEQGKLRLDQRLTVHPETARIWRGRGTSMWLEPSQQVTVDALLKGIAIASANDASVVLAEGAAGSVSAWTDLMNAEARKVGMTGSHFATPNGWPDGGKTRVNAVDLVRLGQAMIERHPDLYRRFFGKKTFDWNGATLRSHDPAVGVVEGADGIKTGHTRESGYSFLGTAARDGRRIMIVIGGAQTEQQRAAAARALIEWGFAAWEARPLFARGKIVGAALVQGGNSRRVELTAPRDISLTVPRSSDSKASMRIRYRGPLVAPIAAGAKVAELEVQVPGQPEAYHPLLAGRAVGPASPFDRLVNGLAGLMP